MTTIEWARNEDGTAGRTWNAVTGCDRVSEGCDNCYAMTMAARLKAMGQAKYQRDGDPRTSGPGFGLTVHPDALDIPLRRRKPTTWFVNSMSDLFHKDVPDEFICEVFGVMRKTDRHIEVRGDDGQLRRVGHTFQVLTKRPQRMASFVSRLAWSAPTAEERAAGKWGYQGYLWDDGVANQLSCGGPYVLPNVWLGTSIEADRYTFRADHLRATPAAVRFLSCEPLLGPLPSLDLTGIDWVIAGAESGRGARPMNMDWVRDLRDRSAEAGAAFFLKQDATPAGRKIPTPELDGEQWVQMPGRKAGVA